MRYILSIVILLFLPFNTNAGNNRPSVARTLGLVFANTPVETFQHQKSSFSFARSSGKEEETVIPHNVETLRSDFKPLCVNDADDSAKYRSTVFNYRQVILPAMMLTAGLTGLYSWQTREFNREVRNGMADLRQGRYFRADDYIQHLLPVVSCIGLGLIGAKAKHSLIDRTIVTATSYLAMGLIVTSIKYSACEMRPDGTTRNSFPSGHTATAFMGAELVRMEYGTGYGIGAYAVACSVGFLRMYNNRHWATDVVAGAGVGILSAHIGYWMLPVNRKIFGLDKKRKAPAVAACPSYDPVTGSYGATLAVRF